MSKKIWYTKGERTRIIIERELFSDCNLNLLMIDDYEVKVSVWDCSNNNGTLKDFIKILTIIEETKLLATNFSVWRDAGYYDATDDITMNFTIDKNLLSKLRI